MRHRRPIPDRHGSIVQAALLALALAGPQAAMAGDSAPELPQGAALAQTLRDLDAQVFGAFNGCADAASLERHASYFAEDVEFYHDNGGVTWNRAAMIENTRKHACGRYTRELVASRFEVAAIAGFGALTRGVHRFCKAGGACEGEADFLMVWRYRQGQWSITRVFSFGHRPST